MSAYLDTRETADFFGRSESTIRNWVKDCRVPCRKLPGTRNPLFVQTELARWVEGGYEGVEVKELPNDGLVVRLLPPSSNGGRPGGR